MINSPLSNRNGNKTLITAGTVSISLGLSILMFGGADETGVLAAGLAFIAAGCCSAAVGGSTAPRRARWLPSSLTTGPGHSNVSYGALSQP